MQENPRKVGRAEGIDLYSVVTSTDPGQPNYPPSGWLESEGWEAPVLLDDRSNSGGRVFGVNGFPFWVFVDAERKVAARRAGELSMPELEEELARLSLHA